MSERGRPRKAIQSETPLAKRLNLLFAGRQLQYTAGVMGVTDKTARHYLQGDFIPQADILERVTKHYRCDPGWLLSGEGEMFPDRVAEAAGPYGGIRFPVLGLAGADGSGRVAYSLAPTGEHVGIKPQTGCLQAKGSSMAPVILDGQYVLYDLSDRSVHPKDLVVAEITDLAEPGKTYAVVKRYDLQGDLIILTSINPVAPEDTILLKKTRVRSLHLVLGVLFTDGGK